MGSAGSKSNKKKRIREKELQALASMTKFTASEVTILYQKYTELCAIELDIPRFCAILGLKSAKFAERIYLAFQSDENTFDFITFVKSLSAVSPRSSAREKAEFVFRVYDRDRCKCIGESELKEMLCLSLEENKEVELTEKQIEKLVQITLDQYGTDGKITLESFCVQAERSPGIMKFVTLSIDKLFG